MSCISACDCVTTGQRYELVEAWYEILEWRVSAFGLAVNSVAAKVAPS